MLTGLDDILSMDEVDEAQSHSGSARLMLDIDIDKLLEVGSHDCDDMTGFLVEESGGMQIDEMSLDSAQCHQADDDNLLCSIGIESVDSVGTGADWSQSSSFADQEPTSQSRKVYDTEAASHECFQNSEAVQQCDSVKGTPCEGSSVAAAEFDAVDSDGNHPVLIDGEVADAVLESESLSLGCDEIQCSPNQNGSDDVMNNVVSEDCPSTVESYLDAVQVVEQHDSCSTTDAEAEPNLQTCVIAAALNSDSSQQDCLPVLLDLVEPENNSCISEVAEVEIQNDGHGSLSTHTTVVHGEVPSDTLIVDNDWLQCSSNQNENGSLGNNMFSDNVPSTVESYVDVMEHHIDSQEIFAEADLGLNTCDGEGSNSLISQQENFPVLVDCQPENGSFISEAAEVEVQSDDSDVISVCRETDEDCVICISESEEPSYVPTESEGKMTVRLLGDDHDYCLPAKSTQCNGDIATCTSNGICQEFVSQPDTNLSLLSPNEQEFNMSPILPFPSLITDPGIDDLCSYDQPTNGECCVDNASILEITPIQSVDAVSTGTLVVGDQSDCMVIDNSSYPVVEIVPHSYDEPETSQFERSELKNRDPTCSGAVSHLSVVADTQSDNVAPFSIAAPTSHRAKVQI